MIPKISVIVPVYNVESYLRRCIDSILDQTYKNIEIVLIDDGSTDSSGDICDIYADRYAIIKSIHKENKGPSDTRNVGVENAKGEYIYFLDSDDYIIRDCLDILYKNAKESDADLSCGSFGFFDDNHPVQIKARTNSVSSCSGEKACIDLLYGRCFYTSSCNILIKQNIARGSLFPVGKYHEDEMTTFRYFLKASRVVKTEIQTYFYYQREGSIMHSRGQPVIDEALSADYYVDVCGKVGGMVSKAALCKKYFLYVDVLESYPEIREKEPELYCKLKEYVRHNSISIMLDFYAPFSIKKKAVRYLVE